MEREKKMTTTGPIHINLSAHRGWPVRCAHLLEK